MEGWICPRCHKSLAPWMRECDCKAESLKMIVTVNDEEVCPVCFGRRDAPGGTACGNWHYGTYCFSSAPMPCETHTINYIPDIEHTRLLEKSLVEHADIWHVLAGR